MRALKFLLMCCCLLPSVAMAASETAPYIFHITQTLTAKACLFIFAAGYIFVMLEEVIHLRKSKPVIIASGLIWILLAAYVQQSGADYDVHAALRSYLTEFVELFLFLLVAMTYVNTLEDRQVFQAMRQNLLKRRLSYRQLFWVTGFLAFFISPIADNLTTALLMCAVVIALAPDSPKFINLCCINIVVAANAGGAFSPFGDITTLMVWQDNILHFYDFFRIFLPSLVNFLIPALCMNFAVPNYQPPSIDKPAIILPGGFIIVGLFLASIVTAVIFHNILHLPAAAGMMLGLGYLQVFSYFLKLSTIKKHKNKAEALPETSFFDIFKKIQRAEWDTLLFFYGIILCVGGLATIGYLDIAGDYIYNQLDFGLSAIHQQTPANIIMGILSALIDNIPVMFAILSVHPTMSDGQWLLITLTAGVGGSLLSIGSAAGVALMGQSRGAYTFISHMKWAWAILLGYIASIAVHIWINHETFLSMN